MEPIQYLRALRRRWLVVIGAVVVATLAAIAVSQGPKPVAPSAPYASFAATTTIYDTGLASGTSDTVFPLSTLPTIIGFPNVGVAAAKHTNGKADPIELASQVSAFADDESGFLDITGVGGTPKEAELVSWAYWQGLKDYLAEQRAHDLREEERGLRTSLATARSVGASLDIAAIEQRLAEIAVERLSSVTLAVIQPPVANEVAVVGFRPPRSPRTRVLLAALLGLLAGLGLALVLERFDTRIRTRQRAEEYFDLPVLAEIPVIKRQERDKVSVVVNPTGKASDAFRLLGASVGGAWAALLSARSNGNGHGTGSPGATPKTVLVTSPGPGDGKTTVAANLAAVYGELGKRVMVISCDLRRPSIHRLFRVDVSPGLSELLRSDGSVGPAPVPTGIPNVSVIPSGRSPASPGELLGAERMHQVLQQVEAWADVVVLDCSPVLVASDITALLPQVDVVLLVGRAGKTHADLAERTTEVLRGLGAPVIGVALNAAHEISMPTSYRRYYRPTKEEQRMPGTHAAKGSSGEW